MFGAISGILGAIRLKSSVAQVTQVPNFFRPAHKAKNPINSPKDSPKKPAGEMPKPGGGVDGFIAAVSRMAAQTQPGSGGKRRFMLEAGESFAFIRLQDVGRPLRFLKQMAGQPPQQFGSDGFRADMVDDKNPARHYMAFVFLGFWLPNWLAVVGLWLWEVAGSVRYGYWASKDLQMGYIGIRHGRAVRSAGPTVLPGLIAAELAAPPEKENEERDNRER